MLNFLVNYALCKHNKETIRRSNNATNKEVLEVNYALACYNSFAKYNAVLRCKIKELGLTKVEYHKAR
jgi:hypothetical protein